MNNKYKSYKINLLNTNKLRNKNKSNSIYYFLYLRMNN